MTKRKTRRLTPFGRAVKKRLIDKRMTQKQLALEVGIRTQYIGLIIYGVRPSSKYIPKICEILGINAEKYVA